ncbi:MAG: ECF-type sigma factor [Acidobacteriota bacterium]
MQPRTPEQRDADSSSLAPRTARPSTALPSIQDAPQETGNRITELLRAAADGDDAAQEQVVEWAYSELERLAAARLRRRHRGGTPTLEPAALVNETFLRLLPKQLDFQNRRHLLAFAGTIMLRVLVDYQRERGAQKRGGDAIRVTLSGLGRASESGIGILDFHLALERLQEMDPRKAEVVRLRLLWGCEMTEVAKLLETSLSTVERDWRFARTWLANALESTRSTDS